MKGWSGREAAPYVKAEADGNDFLLLPASAIRPAERGEIARAICDRRRGIGADGVEWWRFSPRRRELWLELHNADGSEAEWSGNGTRCAVTWCGERFGAEEMTVITAAGRKRARRLAGPPEGWAAAEGSGAGGTATGGAVWVEMEMGPPVFAPAAIPAEWSAAQRRGAAGEGQWMLEAAGRRWPVTALAMGNPQCCTLVEAFPADWAEAAAALGRHPAFARQANVELVRVVGAHEIEIRICERGAGVTLSSGTGSCAAAVTAILAGRVQSPVRVRTQGGMQEVAWAGGESAVVLRGPARLVGVGRWRRTGGAVNAEAVRR